MAVTVLQQILPSASQYVMLIPMNVLQQLRRAALCQRRTRPLLAIGSFTLVGVLLIVMSRAATTVYTTEPESGSKAGLVQTIGNAAASGGQAVKFGSAGGSCQAGTLDLSCWPNTATTGYQNAPGYPGTAGVADPTKLTTGSSGSNTCPLTFQSNHTYSFCKYTGGIDIGLPNNHLTNVHFVGFLLEDNGPINDSPMIKLYCDNNCTMDYFTIKPANLNTPDIPAPKHGTSYAKSYGSVLGAGWGAYNTYARGFTLSHSDIWGFQSGIILGGTNTAATPNVIQDNYLHDQGQCMEIPGCPTHADGIGMVDTGGTAQYITINHNNMPFIQDNTNNIAFQEGTYDHLTITNNILSGDGYTVAIWDTSTNTTFTGNIWTNYGQHYFGVNYGRNFWDRPGSTWAHNHFVWDPSGANPFYEDGPGNGNAGPITPADSGKCWVPSGLSATDYGGGSC